MFEASRSEVVPRETHNRGKKIMLTVFFSGERLLVMEALPKGRKFSQNYFRQSVLAALSNEKQRYCRKNRAADFLSTWTMPHLTRAQEMHRDLRGVRRHVVDVSLPA
jgi:hypothetical protein